MKARPLAYLTALLLAAGALLDPVSWAFAADETAPAVPGGAADEAAEASPDTYLAPLMAVEENEAAFVDQLWALGNARFARIAELKGILAAGSATAEEGVAIREEIRRRIQELKGLAEYGVARYSQNARVRNFNGNVHYDALGDQAGGLKEWHMATTLDSSYPNPYNNLGMHYFHVGHYPLGFENMDKALELDPDNPDFCFNMAQNYLIFRPQTEEYRGWSKKKVYKEAMELSRRAAEEAPADYEILEDYAVNFFAAANFGVEADWKKAAKAWQAARTHVRNDTERFYTWLNEGRVWREKGATEEALRCFQEALKIRPDNDVALRNVEKLQQGDG